MTELSTADLSESSNWKVVIRLIKSLTRGVPADQYVTLMRRDENIEQIIRLAVSWVEGLEEARRKVEQVANEKDVETQEVEEDILDSEANILPSTSSLADSVLLTVEASQNSDKEQAGTSQVTSEQVSYNNLESSSSTSIDDGMPESRTLSRKRSQKALEIQIPPHSEIWQPKHLTIGDKRHLSP
jgi:hypothetical protein